VAAEWGFGEIIVDEAIAKVSIVGAGMVNQPGVAAQMFDALAKEQINILSVATSEIKVSCVVEQSEGSKALQAIHAAFNLAEISSVEVTA
jgi:aspartate kinase